MICENEGGGCQPTLGKKEGLVGPVTLRTGNGEEGGGGGGWHFSSWSQSYFFPGPTSVFKGKKCRTQKTVEIIKKERLVYLFFYFWEILGNFWGKNPVFCYKKIVEATKRRKNRKGGTTKKKELFGSRVFLKFVCRRRRRLQNLFFSPHFFFSPKSTSSIFPDFSPLIFFLRISAAAAQKKESGNKIVKNLAFYMRRYLLHATFSLISPPSLPPFFISFIFIFGRARRMELPSSSSSSYMRRNFNNTSKGKPSVLY